MTENVRAVRRKAKRINYTRSQTHVSWCEYRRKKRFSLVLKHDEISIESIIYVSRADNWPSICSNAIIIFEFRIV